MATKLIISLAAEDDVDSAYRWYESRRAGLGMQFLKRFRACAESLAAAPEAHAIVAGRYRRALLHQFPYAVFYDHVGDAITIYAVFHSSRNPSAWKTRLP